MAERPRFSIELTLRDERGERIRYCLPLADEELRISARIVEAIKSPAVFGMSFESAVKIMQRKEYRRDLFRLATERLAMLLADRMEDAEGWHDQSRIEPARKQLGGRWSDY